MEPNGKDQAQQKSPEAGFRVPPRTWGVWIAVFAGIILLMLFRDRMDSESPINQAQFERLVERNQIVHATILYHPNSLLNEIKGRYTTNENGRTIEMPFHAKVRLTVNLEEKLLSSEKFNAREANGLLLNIVWSVMPIVIIATLIWFFFIRQIKRVARNSPSTVDLQAKQSEQLARFDRILDKWEAQATRMDGVLQKFEAARQSKD